MAVPSAVCTVTTTALSSVLLPCKDTRTDMESVLSVSLKVYVAESNPIVTAEKEEKW